MHIFFMTRGIKHHVDEFIKQLSCQFLPYRANLPGKKGLQDGVLQVRLSPIQLWDVSFPEPYKDAMLTTPFGEKKDITGKTINERNNKYANLIRMGMGVKKIPKDYDTKQRLACTPQHTEMIAIGMKEDRFENDQEMI